VAWPIVVVVRHLVQIVVFQVVVVVPATMRREGGREGGRGECCGWDRTPKTG